MIESSTKHTRDASCQWSINYREKKNADVRKGNILQEITTAIPEVQNWRFRRCIINHPYSEILATAYGGNQFPCKEGSELDAVTTRAAPWKWSALLSRIEVDSLLEVGPVSAPRVRHWRRANCLFTVFGNMAEKCTHIFWFILRSFRFHQSLLAGLPEQSSLIIFTHFSPVFFLSFLFLSSWTSEMFRFESKLCSYYVYAHT